MNVSAALLEVLLHDANQVGVGSGKKLIHQLDDRNLRSELLIHHAELEPDDAPADEHHALGRTLKADRFAGGDHDVTVRLEAGDLNHLRTGRDDDCLARRVGFLFPVSVRHLDGVGAGDRGTTHGDGATVALHEARHAAN